MTCEYKHLEILINSLSDYICSQYDGLDAEIVDIPKTMENIKIASDMQLVLKHHLGSVVHSPKQTAETTGLIWCKEIDLGDQAEPFEPFNDEELQDNSKSSQQAWNNVKERHWDTIKRTGEK